jgi:hypothetical protein
MLTEQLLADPLYYWALVIWNLLIAWVLVSYKKPTSWVPKLFFVCLIWPCIWALVVIAYNLGFGESDPWRYDNYVFDALYRPILAILFDSNWVWLAPDSLMDLAHITAVTHLTAFWSKNKGPDRIRVETPAEAHQTDYLIEKYPKGRKQVNGPVRSALEGSVDYRALVDANSVRTLAVNIASTHLENELAVLLRAAALFEYVKKNVTYVPDPIHMSGGEMIDGDYVASPVETLDARGGDCDDQAVLIASLFSAVGIENRMRLISNTDNEWHLLTEFRVDLSLMDEFIAALDGFYDSGERDTGPRTYIYFTEDDGVWLLADTTRDYVGDYQSLMEQGFLYTSDDGIYWTNCASIH